METRVESSNGVADARVAERERRDAHVEEGGEVTLGSTLVRAEAYRSGDAAWRQCGGRNGEDGGSIRGLSSWTREGRENGGVGKLEGSRGMVRTLFEPRRSGHKEQCSFAPRRCGRHVNSSCPHQGGADKATIVLSALGWCGRGLSECPWRGRG